ncbi:response regulator transcription factor [Streptomyces sp. NPDC058326]|uniref:response regulator transcription factor n=1 Tax=Streptomyces sp. NPDC058326 TaxID=3346447 RepID=UPI0036E82396
MGRLYSGGSTGDHPAGLTPPRARRGWHGGHGPGAAEEKDQRNQQDRWSPWGRWQRGDGDGGLPWRSTVVIALFVIAGSGFASRNQPDREALDAFGRALLLLGAAALLFRHRRSVPVVFGAAAVTLGHLAAGYPLGPVFVLVAVACFAAVVHGHRAAAAWALGLLWAGHLLLSHWLYQWLPPTGDGPAPWGQELPAAAFALAVLAASETVRVRREQGAQQRAERVMALVGMGLSNEEIARRLVVSPLTAKTHVSRAMVKFGARDRAQLVVQAYESGLVRPGWLG